MSDYISEYVHLSFTREEARIRKSASATTTKATIVKLEIEVYDAATLSMLMQSIQEAMRPLPPKRADPTGRQLLEAQRTLAAPPLQLEYRRNG